MRLCQLHRLAIPTRTLHKHAADVRAILGSSCMGLGLRALSLVY
jgi:hypothetical protein